MDRRDIGQEILDGIREIKDFKQNGGDLRTHVLSEPSPPDVIRENWSKEAISQQIIADLCKRVKDIRLSRNITQAQLAADAGISRSTVERMETGGNVSLDSFISVLIALDVQAGLQTALPDFSFRPMDRVRMHGRERLRAFPRKKKINGPWGWGEKATD